jgi:hypothetical protein
LKGAAQKDRRYAIDAWFRVACGRRLEPSVQDVDVLLMVGFVCLCVLRLVVM